MRAFDNGVHLSVCYRSSRSKESSVINYPVILIYAD